MKRFLILALVLVCAPLWADGGWDLTKPANNGYVASFPAEVRANQTAIVASLTPPIEWTGDVTQYGTPSARLGFGGLTGEFRYPTFWLGSIGTSAAYIFGPSEQVPVGIPNDEAPGWFAYVASYPSGDPGEKCYMQFGMPNGNGTAQAYNILVQEDRIALVDRKITGVATGTAAQDAVNLGQMNAAINSVQVVANMSDGTGSGYASWGGTAGALATFTYEMVDSHAAWDGATFTAPLAGVYEIRCQIVFAPSPVHAGELTAYAELFTDSNKAASPASAPLVLMMQTVATATEYLTSMSGSAFLPLGAADTFVINLATTAGTSITVRLQDARLYIRRVADLP